VRQNRLWFVSGDYLFQQDPQLTIERGENGVDTIDLNLDMGARDSIAQCTVNARTDMWAALPGMIVQVNNRGPATGKWFVASFESHPLDESQQVTITLQKPVPKRAEPAATDITNQATRGRGVAADTKAGTPNSRGVINPIPGFKVGRQDMGVDGSAAPGTPIFAPADCVLVSGPGGFPGVAKWYAGQPLLLFQFLTKPPGAPTSYWYVAEQIVPTSTQGGTMFKQGAVVATFANSGTGIEIGWGSPTSNARTYADEQGRGWEANPASGQSTVDGASFKAFFGIG
jgi:hypothetical protein